MIDETKDCDNCELSNLTAITASLDEWKYCPKCGSKLENTTPDEEQNDMIQINITDKSSKTEKEVETESTYSEKTTEELINEEIEQIKEDIEKE